MNVLENYFLSASPVEGITEKDYRQVMPMMEMLDMHARLSYENMYIIDFNKKNLLYVSDSPFFLDSLSPLEVQEMGLLFHIRRIPEEELNMLLEINRAGFDFIHQTPVKDRLQLTFSCDFHIKGGNDTTLINHKLTPFRLSGNGNIWLAGCLVSLSSWMDAGHAEVRMKGKTEWWTYSLQSHEWEQKSGTVLTDREKKVLKLSRQGMTIEKISDELHVGINTVKSCRHRLYKELNVNNISEAIAVAINSKLI